MYSGNHQTLRKWKAMRALTWLNRLGIVAAMALGMGVLGIGAAQSAPCMLITLTGVQGGPSTFNGQAGAGTLVQYGDDENNCRDVHLLFDTGRGTTQRLFQAKTPVGLLNAIFFTHMHSDHTEGLPDLLQFRWHINSKGPQVDVVCSDDAESPAGHTLSCRNFTAHIGDPLIQSGEVAQRIAENRVRLPGGPADLINVIPFTPADTPAEVWSKDDVTVTAIRSTHIAGHASYRVDTPAGSVVIGGDAGNDTNKPPRETSTSAQVELLAKDVDVIVHSVIHPVMGPDGGTGFPPPIFFRQSGAADLGAMAMRAGAKHLMLTHLIPPVGAPNQGPLFPLPDGPLSEADYRDAAMSSGFLGNVVVGSDLVSLRLPAQ